MNEPSPVSSTPRSWLFVLFETRFDPATLFFPDAYIHWRLPKRLQVSAGDIVYVVAFIRRLFVGWGLVREALDSSDVAIQMLGLALKQMDVGEFLRELSVSQEMLQTARKFELSGQQIQSLDSMTEQFGTLLPNLHPEVIRFRTELSDRARHIDSAWESAGQRAPEIGPMAAVEGKWTQIADLVALRLPSGESYFSDWVSTILTTATALARRRSREEYRIVDASELLKGILARAQLGRPTSVPKFAPWEVLDWLLGKLKSVEKSIPDLQIDGAVVDASPAVASPGVTSILANAARIAQVTHHARVQVDMRHLLVAHLLSTEGRAALVSLDLIVGEPKPFFVKAGEVLRAHLVRTMSEFGDDPRRWDTILARFDDLDLSTPEEKAPITVQHTAYAADRPGSLADDALDAAKDARALAELICLEEAQPPLAIGLFGDWGSGKSTFMEMLAEAIDEVTTRTTQEPSLPFVDRVAHIRFNAWHYMDANLWASLVTHIFKELHRQSRDKDQPRDWLKEAQLDGLIERLGIVQQAEGEARGQLQVLSKQIDDAKKRLAAIEQERATARMQLAGQYVGDMLELISVGGPNSDVGNAAQAIGLGVDTLTARQLHETISEAATLGGRLKLLVTTLTMGTDKGLKWLLLGIVVFIAIGGSAAALAALLPGLQSIAATFGTILGLVSGAGAWLGPHLHHINKSLGPLIDAHNNIMTTFQQQEHERTAKKAETEAKIEQLEVQQRQQERGLQEKLEERQRLEAIARGERPTELLARFIASRTEAEDYRKHLGLLSFVRSDFEKVSALMREQRINPDPTLPAIDRVVLYIDDLDRCQDKQVVQVLEAVHLLLAFDLFVVVVGVDARWLHRALEKIYPDQLGERGPDHASPADYLEKIFQIPFWLRALDYGEQGTFGRLIDRLVGADVEVTARAPADTPAAADGASLQPTDDGPPSPASIESDGNEVTTVIAPVAVTLEHETPEETLQRVKLRDTEVTLIKELGPLVGKSPRAAKRFVNLYRLVRARKRGAELERFLDSSDDEQAQYPTVMLILAIEVGLSPDEAAAAWRHIQSVDDNASIELPFEAGKTESDRKIEAAIGVIQRTTGLPLLREHFVSILGEISRYSFSRPT